jgi:hypothetical protein
MLNKSVNLWQQVKKKTHGKIHEPVVFLGTIIFLFNRLKTEFLQQLLIAFHFHE